MAARHGDSLCRSTLEAKTRDCEFKARLNYIMRLWPKKARKREKEREREREEKRKSEREEEREGGEERKRKREKKKEKTNTFSQEAFNT